MKKKWVYVGLIFWSLLIAGYFFRYHTKGSLENKIPANASQIVKINLRQLEKEVLLDILTHPIKYIRKKKGRKVKINRRFRSFSKGIPIPKNLMFYTLEKESTWISNSLAMKDSGALTKLLLKEGFTETAVDGFTILNLNKLHFLFSEIELIIVFGEALDNKELKLLFEEKPYLKTANPLLMELHHNSADISYINSKGSYLEADFKKGAFEMSGTLGAEFNALAVANHQVYTDPLLTVVTKFNTEDSGLESLFSEKLKNQFKETIHLSLDSILNDANGVFSFHLASVEKVSESIISYDYDDDFNAIETISTQEVVLPNLEINLGQRDSSMLYPYFLRKKAIQNIDGENLFTSIPIYKFKVNKEANMLQLLAGTAETSIATIKTKWIGNFKVKEYLKNRLEIPLSKSTNGFLNLIDQITTEIDPENRFQGRIEMINPYRNFLGQLIRP